MSAVDYLLQETAVGYGLYQVINQADTIGNRLKEVQEAAQDLAKFGKMVKLVSFAPFKSVLPCARLRQYLFPVQLLTRGEQRCCRGP